MVLSGAHTPGATPHLIRTSLRELYAEVRGWLNYRAYPPDEIAIRLKVSSRDDTVLSEWQWAAWAHARSHRHASTFWIGTAAPGRKCIA